MGSFTLSRIGVGPHLVGGADDLRAGGLEVTVVDRRTVTGARLDDHVVAAASQLGDTTGGDGHPELVVLDLGGDADEHDRSFSNVFVGMPTGWIKCEEDSTEGQ